MNYQVPAVSVAAICVTLAVVLGLPLVNLFYLKRKKGAKVSDFFIGAVTFVVFALLLEQIWHTVIRALTGSLLTDNILLYAIYGGLSAGLFEETGRYLAMKFCMEKKGRLNAGSALMYGAGHGGIEAWLVVGLAYISNIAMVILINSGSMDTILASLDEASSAATLTAVEQLCTLPAWQFLLAAVERIGAIYLHIVLSYMVYLAIRNSRKSWFLLAVGLHALVDAGLVLLSQNIPLVVVELLILAVVGGVGFVLHRTYPSET